MARPVPRFGSAPLSQLSFPRLLGACAAVSLVGAQVLHEAGHCLVSLLFGRAPVWGFSSLVQLAGAEPLHPEAWVRYLGPSGDEAWLRLGSLPASQAEWVIWLAAGPVVELLAIAVGLVVAHRASGDRMRLLGQLLALVNVFGLVTYYGLSLLGGIGGDEALLAAYLDLPPAAIVVPLAGGALAGLVAAFRAVGGRRERLRLAVALPMAILPQGPAIMLANRLVSEEVDAGNPLFGDVLGFSLPVLVAALAAAGFAAWATGPGRSRPSPTASG